MRRGCETRCDDPESRRAKHHSHSPAPGTRRPSISHCAAFKVGLPVICLSANQPKASKGGVCVLLPGRARNFFVKEGRDAHGKAHQPMHPQGRPSCALAQSSSKPMVSLTPGRVRGLLSQTSRRVPGSLHSANRPDPDEMVLVAQRTQLFDESVQFP